MPPCLALAFDLKNINKAWRWVLTSDAKYKNYFRNVYSAYSTTDEQNLKKLKDKLSRGIYRPTYACKIYYPKKSGILRPISLLAIEDQIIYQALVNVIADKLLPRVRNRYFKEVFGHLYSGRKSKFFYKKWQDGYRAFDKAIRETFSAGYIYRANFDLTAYYDSIDHNVLKYFLSDLGLDNDFNNFLINCLKHWTSVSDEQKIFQGHGIPQGPIASGLLSEVILSYFDSNKRNTRKVKYFRYVDDIRLYAKKVHDLRHQLVELDLLSKSVGLFPQSAKIDIKKVENIADEIKSISNPPDPVNRISGDQKRVRKALVQHTKYFKIRDETKLKWIIAQLVPTSAISKRLFRLLKNSPHLYSSVFRYLRKYTEIPTEISKELLNLLQEEDLYPTYSAELIMAMIGKTQTNMVHKYTRAINKIVRERCNFIGSADLYTAANSWSLYYRELRYDETMDLFQDNKSWWSRVQLLNHVDMSFIGTPSYEVLLNDLVKSNSVDLSVTAAYLLAINNLNLESPRRHINSTAEIILKNFGLIRRAKSFECGIVYALREMDCNPVCIVPWKNIFGSRYKDAERKIVRAKSYFKTDPTAWVNIIDTFDDMLVDSLFSHDTTLGSFSLGNLGSVLHSTSRFANNYPELFEAVSQIHKKRLESDLSHPIEKRTGKVTRPIKHSYIGKAKKLLFNGYSELMAKW